MIEARGAWNAVLGVPRSTKGLDLVFPQRYLAAQDEGYISRLSMSARKASQQVAPDVALSRDPDHERAGFDF